ncbi:MAG: putative GNAT superfamily acetyltransferase [Candidatus Azotimanducaceae bacterium]|jgi:predicted GNAT superfamily acetyltransferase|tara:strand:- start:430 stop:930 length:501 start_codon:yes stop_codon:yes gene_type:complete
MMHEVSQDPLHWRGEVLALNNDNTPHVNALSEQSLDVLIEQAASFRVMVSQDNALSGFVLLLREGQAYESLNYRWFSEAFEEFLYVDRIIIAPPCRGQGVAQALYGHATDLAQAMGIKNLTCEVNLAPPNPRSLAFHHAQGFQEMAQQMTDGGRKRVSLLRKAIDA